jgi:tRNA(fMet)-specific endonuclease VapC
VKLLLDTNVLSKIMSGRPEACRLNAQASRDRGEQQFTSVIVLHELFWGAERSVKPNAARERVSVLIGALHGVVEFTERDAEIAAIIRARLAEKGQGIGPFDTLIAAQAFRLDATLVTGNVREFERVEGLKWIDWTQV